MPTRRHDDSTWIFNAINAFILDMRALPHGAATEVGVGSGSGAHAACCPLQFARTVALKLDSRQPSNRTAFGLISGGMTPQPQRLLIILASRLAAVIPHRVFS